MLGLLGMELHGGEVFIDKIFRSGGKYIFGIDINATLV
jgi:hypothetical protein